MAESRSPDGDSTHSLPWIRRTPGAPYFEDEGGRSWTPIGQNDSIIWPELAGLFHRRDLHGVEAHLRYLRRSGVTCLRLMLEYCHREHRYFERPAGRFVPAMVHLWDDLFELCERTGLRVLLTPFDTFFTWVRWKRHPYNRLNGGPCASPGEFLLCKETRMAVKARLAFATERWGGTGVIFAWDLWNEMHPAHAGNEPERCAEFIDDVSPFLRDLERRLHGRAHLQCVSVFGPELVTSPAMAEPVFRHPLLDFANSHFYEHGTIDDPRDTVAAALSTGRLVREALSHISDDRPFFDSEHGPIHRFKDKRRSLPVMFDDEYFRHMQWAHLASGGAGGGMRWPNRKPHVLTPGMRAAQRAMAGFLPLIDWRSFQRREIGPEIRVDDADVATFGCADAHQAVVWLLRRAPLQPDGRVDGRRPSPVRLQLPRLSEGRYRALAWNTTAGCVLDVLDGTVSSEGVLRLTLPALGADMALAVRRTGSAESRSSLPGAESQKSRGVLADGTPP